MDFNPNKALAYAQALARPRLVGSGEEERVAQEVVDQLRAFGYNVAREPFQYTRAFDQALAYEIGLALFLILLSLIWPIFKIPAGLVIMVLLIGTVLVNDLIQRRAVAPDPNPVQPGSPFLRWGRLYRTANIVARAGHADSAREDRPQLYLVAHYDSKSQRMPIVVRVVLIGVLIVSLGLFVITTLAMSDLTPFPAYMGGLALLAGAPLLLLDVGNESPGAIDNASGLGLVLHLAEILQSRPELLEQVQITILVTSAEEMATMGALYHVQRHLTELRHVRQRLAILNFDGVGVDGGLAWSGRYGMGVQLAKAARALKIRIRPFQMPGLLFDHIPFVVFGLNAATLMTIGSATWAVHTANDTVDKLSAAGFEQAGRVALRLIEQLATGQA